MLAVVWAPDGESRGGECWGWHHAVLIPAFPAKHISWKPSRTHVPGCSATLIKVNIYQKDPPQSPCLRAHVRRKVPVQKFQLTWQSGDLGRGGGDLRRGSKPPEHSTITTRGCSRDTLAEQVTGGTELGSCWWHRASSPASPSVPQWLLAGEAWQ